MVGSVSARRLIVVRADVLEARFVDAFCVEHLRIADLQGVLEIRNIVSLGLESKLRYSAIGLLLPVEHVADGQRVVMAELKVETRADVEARLRIGDSGGVVDTDSNSHRALPR